MGLIRCNATDSAKCKWLTVTYKEVMTDGKQAFLDTKLFLRKLKRYLAKQGNLTNGQKSFQYITIAEPQGEKHGNSWHLHMLMILIIFQSYRFVCRFAHSDILIFLSKCYNLQMGKSRKSSLLGAIIFCCLCFCMVGELYV